ncbi:hypothetical protein ILYODFUR_002664 [Ilyodon furcidens]|uniref:Fibronectin type-III domain-containing protein n=1 Tax=Ilyodon furcidens TaxID=33524 RepID=A0ABV0V2K1_9TELE
MWSVNVVILLLFCYACLSTGNGSMHFLSRNFYNVLHWDPVEPAFPGQKVLYSVQYWRDDEKQYWIKQECQNITRLSCNLTTETPSVYDVHYRAKVMVNGSCLYITTNFKPLRDTVLGPPLLSWHTTSSTLHVNVTLPRGPNGVSVADIITSSKKGLLKAVPEYTLKITHPQWAAQVITSTTGHFDINLKYNQSEYCGHVVYIPTPEWGRSVSENASFCVSLPDYPQIPLQWPLLIAAVLGAIVIISAVCTWNYVKGGNLNMPEALVIPSQECKVLRPQDKNLRISEVSFGINSDIMVQTKIKVEPDIVPNESEGYSPQINPWTICQHNPDTSAQSSESYAAVAVQTQDKRNERNLHQVGIVNRQTIQPTWPCSEEETKDKGAQLPKFNLSESDPEQQPLVLNTVRNKEGQLLLTPFTFQLQSSPDDIELQMNRERKPLLSDLFDCQDGSSFTILERLDSSDGRDSGCYDSTINTPTSSYCNTSYSPSETMVPGFLQECQTTIPGDAIFQSGYKQNWMPVILPGPIDIH